MRFSRFAKQFSAIASVLSVLLSMAALCYAQTENATISGRVTDSSGAVIAQAAVELQSADRGTIVQTTTNGAGIYVFPAVHPGVYHIRVSKDGFTSEDYVGLTANVQDHLEQNFRLSPGAVSQSITVRADTASINTTDGSVSTVVDQQLIKELPLNGRSFQGLIQLTPGVVTTPTSNNTEGQFSVNGQRTNTNYFAVDGVSANVGITTIFTTGQSYSGTTPASSVLGGTNSLISTSAVQEFAIQTSSYSPEFGRSPGAQVSIVTRSGTNDFHGEMFEYLRNGVMDANDWFADRNGIAKLAVKQNDFGGVFGGPLRKNKTFFFFSYEGLRLRQPATDQTDVPSLASRQAAPSAMQPFFSAYPLPTGADEGNGLAPAVYGFSNPATLDAVSLRVDHHINSSLSIFGRYNFSPSNSSGRGAGFSLNTTTIAAKRLQTFTTGLTYLLTPQISEDARFNWTKSSGSSSFAEDTFGGGMAMPNYSPPPFTLANSQAFFAVSLQGRSDFLVAGTNIGNIQHQINFIDDISWQIHTHLLKVGVDYRRLTPDTIPVSYSPGVFFGTVAAALAQNPLFADVQSLDSASGIFNNYSIYGQDAWRPIPRLSITYGVRWDYNPAPEIHDSAGLTPLVVRDINNTFPNISVAPNGTPLYHATANNFAPRLGIAYELRSSPETQTVIRAGAGVFYDLGTSFAGQALHGAPYTAISFINGTFPFTPAQLAPPPITRNPPYSGIVGYPPIAKLPYTYHWNLSLQQALGTNQTLTLGYVGAAGHRLIRTEEFFGGQAGVSPDFSSGVSVATDQGYSNYNSFQAEFRRRSTRNLEIIAAYTWSHALDNVSTDARFLAFFQAVNPASDYGPADFDIRHTATVGAHYIVPAIVNSAVARVITSGWSLDPILTGRSSPPVDVTVQRNIGFGLYSIRPDLVPGVPLYLYDSSIPGGREINPGAFGVPTALVQGNLARNYFRAFPLFQADVAVNREFRVSERLRIQARLEAFNIVNHPNFSPEPGRLGSVGSTGQLFPTVGFGISQSMLASGLNTGIGGSGFSPLFQIGGPRSLQLALKLEF